MTSPERLEEYSRRQKRNSERRNVWLKSHEFASDFWKRLVNNLGESEAKEMMRHMTGDKKPGPPRTDEEVALVVFIYANILHFGLDERDGKLAKHIFESQPYYLIHELGCVSVANNEFTETFLSFSDDPVVDRRPIDKSLAAIKKQVGRIRRRAIEEGTLPTSYAPRPYHRD